MLVLLDNGHGENTPGKRSPDGRLREYAYTREIVRRIHDRLTEEGINSIILVPETIDISLGTRTRRVNQYDPAHTILVSVHCNAAGSEGQWMNGRGWEVYTSPGQTKADKLADCLFLAAQRILPETTKMRADLSDGDYDKEANFWILRKSMCPAVLTENLFQDNKEDVEYLLSEEGKRAITELHVQGIKDYLKSVK